LGEEEDTVEEDELCAIRDRALCAEAAQLLERRDRAESKTERQDERGKEHGEGSESRWLERRRLPNGTPPVTFMSQLSVPLWYYRDVFNMYQDPQDGTHGTHHLDTIFWYGIPWYCTMVHRVHVYKYNIISKTMVLEYHVWYCTRTHVVQYTCMYVRTMVQ
jgi:hypothetical protein